MEEKKASPAEQAEEEKAKEERIREEKIREEKAREERAKEEITREERIREERAREERMIERKGLEEIARAVKFTAYSIFAAGVLVAGCLLVKGCTGINFGNYLRPAAAKSDGGKAFHYKVSEIDYQEGFVSSERKGSKENRLVLKANSEDQIIFIDRDNRTGIDYGNDKAPAFEKDKLEEIIIVRRGLTRSYNSGQACEGNPSVTCMFEMGNRLYNRTRNVLRNEHRQRDGLEYDKKLMENEDLGYLDSVGEKILGKKYCLEASVPLTPKPDSKSDSLIGPTLAPASVKK